MKKLRWGILSTAKIGLKKVIPAMQKSQFCEIIAIASRNLEKANEESLRLGIPKAYGSYEKLIGATEIMLEIEFVSKVLLSSIENNLCIDMHIKAFG